MPSGRLCVEKGGLRLAAHHADELVLQAGATWSGVGHLVNMVIAIDQDLG